MIDPFKPLQCVRAYPDAIDPAIDQDKTDLDEYLKTRDFGLLVFKEGMRPTVFVVQPPTAAYTYAVLNRRYQGAEDMKFLFAYLACCHEIITSTGETLVPQKFEKLPHGMRAADENSWLQTTRNLAGLDTIVEIGRVACELGNIRPGQEAGFSSPLGF